LPVSFQLLPSSMSLARARFLGFTRSKLAVPFRRHASSGHGEGHASFPKEDFATPFWRNALIVGGLAVVAYKYAPEPGDNVYLTRWIAMYTPRPEAWLDLNAKHTAQQEIEAENSRLMTSARQPPVYRYRYPQSFEQASPFLVGVGTQADLSNLVVKST